MAVKQLVNLCLGYVIILYLHMVNGLSWGEIVTDTSVVVRSFYKSEGRDSKETSKFS